MRSSILFLVATTILGGCEYRSRAEVRWRNTIAGNAESAHLVGREVSVADFRVLGEKPSLCEVTIQDCENLSDQCLNTLVSEVRDLQRLHLIRVPINDDKLQLLSQAKSLRELTIEHCNISSAGLLHLRECPIQRLEIRCNAIDTDSLSAIGKLTHLEELEIHCRDASLVVLPSLRCLKELRTLVVHGISIGNQGIQSLQGLSQLRKLKLNSPDIDDASIDAINSLTGLEEVEIVSAHLTDNGLNKLKLPRLRLLSLDTCNRITDRGLANLAALRALEYLMLGGTAVQGQDLTPLANLRKLKAVLLMESQFKGNAQTVHALKTQLPDCEIIFMRG